MPVFPVVRNRPVNAGLHYRPPSKPQITNWDGGTEIFHVMKLLYDKHLHFVIIAMYLVKVGVKEVYLLSSQSNCPTILSVLTCG